jgi:lipoate-protein ligase A
MKFLEWSFAEPAANLACDEALLETAEAGDTAAECLRIWESTCHFVVLGHANRIAADVDVQTCRIEKIPILRRISGGGTVVQGPGCLNYSVILNNASRRNIGDIYRLVLGRHRQIFQEMCRKPTRVQGISDLTVDDLKFSGNAQYRKARAALVHGTFLLQFDLAVVDRWLPIPTKQPGYRQSRPHEAFMVNLWLDRRSVVQALRRAWQADQDLTRIPTDRIEMLARERYRDPKWTEKF